MRYVLSYLAAVVVANILFAVALDPSAGYSLNVQLTADFVICFAFIGLDMGLRDKLHDEWGNDDLFAKMTGLILAGSLLSYTVNFALNAAASDIVLRVALASFVAFAGSGFTDFAVYHLLRHRSPLVRVNGSNLPSSFIDSLLFPLVAFGLPMMWNFFAVEFAAKMAGGLIWSAVLVGAGYIGGRDNTKDHELTRTS